MSVQYFVSHFDPTNKVPDAPHGRGLTLLSPFIPTNHWSLRSYQEDSIVPRYLRQSDLHASGEGNENLPSDFQEFSENVGESILISRNFVIAEKVTEEMKNFVRENVEKLRKERNKISTEEAQAENPSSFENRERKELLDRFLQLAEEQDPEQLRNLWKEATRPPPPAPIEPPKLE